jgi:hypothetical protein
MSFLPRPFAARVPLLGDAPIKSPGQDRLGVSGQANLIAQEIQRSAAPMVFGVFGSPGSGKTSFCRLVLHRLSAGVTGGSGARARCWHYECGQHEPSDAPDLSLMYAICAALHGHPDMARAAVAAFLHGVRETRSCDGPVRALGAATQFRMRLRKAMLRNERLVVLVDDLDECKPGFVRATWEAIQRYHSFPGLFFVLACKKETVLSAMHARLADIGAGTSVAAEMALEKYLRWQVELPSLQSDQVESVARSLYDEFESLDLSGPEDRITALMFQEPTNYIDYARSAIQSGPTMRRLKHILNALLPALARIADKHSAGGMHALGEVRRDPAFREDAERLVKEISLDCVLPGAARLRRDAPRRFGKLERLWSALAREEHFFEPSDLRELLRVYAPELLDQSA